MPTIPINRPMDVATRETFAFLASHLPNEAEIIEVGCGDGEVALELAHYGYNVMALDSDVERVAKAQARGVRAKVATWPSFGHTTVDAIAFTRSLHHIDPLDLAVTRAHELLKRSGSLLIEDFAFGEANENTVDWFVKLVRSESPPLNAGEDHLVTRLLSADDPVKAWRESHDKALHSIATLREAISRKFTIREMQSVPYIYRYLIPVLPETKEAATVVERLLGEEILAAKQNKTLLMGRRIIAVPK
jgi:SAM-dependent methyltransferase